MNQKTNYPIELLSSAFSQIMEHIRKQDDLVHSWTKFYLSIQAGMAIALAFLLNMTSNEPKIIVKIGLLFIPLLGITSTICLTNIIVREHKWQGRYIQMLKNIPNIPIIYDISPDPKEPGYIAKQFLWFRWFLISGWLILAVMSIVLF